MSKTHTELVAENIELSVQLEVAQERIAQLEADLALLKAAEALQAAKLAKLHMSKERA